MRRRIFIRQSCKTFMHYRLSSKTAAVSWVKENEKRKLYFLWCRKFAFRISKASYFWKLFVIHIMVQEIVVSCGKKISRYFYSRHSYNSEMRHRSEFLKPTSHRAEWKNTGTMGAQYRRYHETCAYHTISVNHPSSDFTLAKEKFDFKSRSIAPLYKQIDVTLFT